jgi:hypothetical protein
MMPEAAGVSVHGKNRGSYRRTQFILIPGAERPSVGSGAAVRLIQDGFPQWLGQPARERIHAGSSRKLPEDVWKEKRWKQKWLGKQMGLGERRRWRGGKRGG